MFSRFAGLSTLRRLVASNRRWVTTASVLSATGFVGVYTNQLASLRTPAQLNPAVTPDTNGLHPLSPYLPSVQSLKFDELSKIASHSTKHSLVKLYNDDCPHCNMLGPVFEQVNYALAEEPSIEVSQFLLDLSVASESRRHKVLAKHFWDAYPTFVYFDPRTPGQPPVEVNFRRAEDVLRALHKHCGQCFDLEKALSRAQSVEPVAEVLMDAAASANLHANKPLVNILSPAIAPCRDRLQHFLSTLETLQSLPPERGTERYGAITQDLVACSTFNAPLLDAYLRDVKSIARGFQQPASSDDVAMFVVDHFDALRMMEPVVAGEGAPCGPQIQQLTSAAAAAQDRVGDLWALPNAVDSFEQCRTKHATELLSYYEAVEKNSDSLLSIIETVEGPLNLSPQLKQRLPPGQRYPKKAPQPEPEKNK